MLADFDEPSPRHVEQRIDLVRVAVEIFDRERIDRHVGDVEFEEETQDALECLEPFLVPDSDGQIPDAGAAAVPVHDEGDVLGSRTESEGRDDERPQEGMQRLWYPREAGREREMDLAGWRRERVIILLCGARVPIDVDLYDVRYHKHRRREREARENGPASEQKRNESGRVGQAGAGSCVFAYSSVCSSDSGVRL